MPKAAKSRRQELPSLLLEDNSFDWNTKISDIQKPAPDSDSDSEEETEIPLKRKLTRKEKLEQERLEELRLRQQEEELISLENPKTADQFDRLLLGCPNNSELWIKYMSFYVRTAEFDKVRAIAKRALQTINIREEQEKLNVWIALLNFENLHGTEDSLSNCLEEAARINDDFLVYSRMLDIYVSSRKKPELEKLINRVCKKFKDSLECWLHCCECYFQVREQSKARFLFQRALTSLPKKDHIPFISRFALMENKFGFPEEAQTLFEHVLTSYPARTDIWSCYVDMLVKSNLISIARHVLERSRAHRLPPKKMKTLFTKSIVFEEKYGDRETVDGIKKEAEQYVKNYAKILDT